MRVCHYVKPNANSESPTRAIWFQPWTYSIRKTKYETEYGFEFIRVCRGVKDTSTGEWDFTWYTVKTASEFWTLMDNLTPKKTKTYVWSQCPSIDLPLIDAFSETCSQNWKLTLAVIPPAPTIIRWRKNDKSIVLLGVSNIWPTPLPTISTGRTECMHVSKNEKDVLCEHVNLIDDVLKKLSQVVIEWLAFLKTNNLGGFSPTIGAQSFRVWRHKFMHHQILIDCHDDALSLARESLYGARCEVFKGRKPTDRYFELDTNGSYGGVMRDMRVPIRLLSHRYHFTITDLREWVRNYVCIARATIDCPLCVFPMRRYHRLSFPHGRFDTVLAGEELEYALERGYVIDCCEVAIYESAPAFSAYMQALWAMRQMSASLGLLSDAGKYKLLMASFFGRWAQGGKVWEECGKASDNSIRSWIEVNADTSEFTEYRQFGGIQQRLSHETESRESHPAIAACILAGARMQLWRFMAQAGLDNVYYVNTDSLFTNSIGFLRLYEFINPNELSKLKIKGEYSSATFLSEKHIITDAAVRHAGVSQLRLHTDEGDILQTQNSHVAQWIRRGVSPKAQTFETKKGKIEK